MRKIRVSISAVLVSIVACASVSAQIPPEMTAGTVQAVSGSGLTVESKGSVISFQVTDQTPIIFSRPGAASDIKPGSFIGTTNTHTADGIGRSTEVHILPPGVKIGEGDRAMGSATPGSATPRMTNGTVAQAPATPDSSAPRMTNGSVGPVTNAAGEWEFDVDYGDGRRHIIVSPTVPVVVMRNGTLAELKTGTKVLVGSSAIPGGGHSATFISVQR